MPQEQLCWRCNRPGTGTCAWDRSKGVIPVTGWTAREVPWRDGMGVYSTSYAVTACPLFDEQKDYYKRSGVYDSDHIGKKPPLSREILKKMCFRFKCNWTTKEIANELGVNKSTVGKYRKQWKKGQIEHED